MAEGLDIRLSTAATKITHDQNGVRVDTTDPRTAVTATFEGKVQGHLRRRGGGKALSAVLMSQRTEDHVWPVVVVFYSVG